MHHRRHRSSLGTWEMVRAEPAPAIRTLVAGYCGYTEHTRLPLRRLELPGARVVLTDLHAHVVINDKFF